MWSFQGNAIVSKYFRIFGAFSSMHAAWRLPVNTKQKPLKGFADPV
ncbi:hypothetical protein CEV31_2988 [Brucella thiophenivorans]|uniref:Uncharacterized protein n=1 Tax=Brucella thiophenivorans TaxID=571255 RepID=A0A256FJ42_9HYPH|nr:hypothetical protein CEV31_2988 [Brucella thiophenivorans]